MARGIESVVRQSGHPTKSDSVLKRLSAGSHISIGPLTIRYRLASVRRSPRLRFLAKALRFARAA
jgi:hypothetical protein